MTRHINNRCNKEKNQSLTAGGLLVAQKGSRPVWAQRCSGSFSIFFTASMTSSSESWMLVCRSGSSTLPVYLHIKPERRLRGSMLHDIQQRARLTPVKPLAIKAPRFDSWGAYLLLSCVVNLCGEGCVLLSRSGRKPGKGFSLAGEVSLLEICPRGNNKLVIIIFPCSW